MRKALLYIDDFHERTYIEMILKKTGWDVMVISSDLGLNNTIMTFHPNVFVVSQNVKGRSVESIVPKVKKNKGKPKIMVIGKKRPDAEKMKEIGVNSFIESPVDPKILFTVLEKFGGILAKEAFKKLKRARLISEEQFEDIEYGRNKETSRGLEPTLAKAFDDDKRRERYKAILEKTEVPPITTSYKAKEIDKYIEEIEKTRKKEHEELDQKKQEFVKALFDAGKKKAGDE